MKSKLEFKRDIIDVLIKHGYVKDKNSLVQKCIIEINKSNIPIINMDIIRINYDTETKKPNKQYKNKFYLLSNHNIIQKKKRISIQVDGIKK